MIFNLYKQRGETPLECIQRFARGNPLLSKKEKMTYLGRLDPLAEGVLLVATGDDVMRKEEFLGLDKEYDFISIFGFATDTYDILGKIVRVEKLTELSEYDLGKVAMIYEGERDQKYPLYSSKMIARRISPHSASRSDPLLNAGEGKKIKIHKIKFHKLDELSNKELFGRLLMDISKVQGDFRQHEILILWKELLFKNPKNKIFLGKFSAHVSSGTYIRSLVNDMGNTLGCGATTLSIKRKRVGDYKIEDSLR
jgi:tRNA pseudouridine55 synthase